MDKSFEGLLLSIALHILLLIVIWNAKFPPMMPQGDRTEVTLVERTPEKSQPKSKAKTFVTETEKDQKDPVEAINQEADFLSALTKRVKKQMRAVKSGPTVNAAPQAQPQIDPNPKPHAKEVAGQDRPHEDEGIGLPMGGPLNRQLAPNIAIGQSTIAEYIPGIEEGAFTALNTDQFTYYAFFARINEQIRNRWIANVRNYMSQLSTKDQEFLSRQDRHTVVEIVLNPEGQFSSSVLQGSSGDNRLDQTTVDAFRAAAPFPNPPRGMVESDGMIHLRYGFVVTFRPPSFSPASN